MANFNNDWERNQAEKYAEKYWKENGFDYKVKRKYISKCIYIVSKDGLEFPYAIPCDVTDRKKYMALFQEQFEMRKEIERLKKQE